MVIKKKQLPTILGIILLAIGTFLGVFLVNKQQIFKLGASSDAAPKDIRVSNISDSAITISWITDLETEGFVLWGTSENDITTPEQETQQKSFAHSVTISGLSPQTNYFYKINSNGTEFDNEGIAWQATTKNQKQGNAQSFLISGSVLTATGQPIKKALVYANVGGALLSTLTSDTGNYVFQLGNIGKDINPGQTLVELFVQTGNQGVSSAQIFPQSARPAPPIILGQTHDFRGEPPSNEGDTPSALLDLPSDSQSESKLDVPDQEAPTTQEAVTLDSIQEGEEVTSTQPEFFGDGPKGTVITVKVESENPQSEDITVGNNGSWSWSPPEGLAAGVHKVTITWKDINGITRSLTRNFVVQAGEAPAFEASGSAQTQTPSPTPTATIKATAAPTASATASSSATPLPTAVPDTGSLTPTIILTIMGGGIFILSFVIWKYSNA